MSVAFLSSQRSKDPNKQVGACIVDANQVICGIGYNGFPRGCPDEHLPWAKQSVHNDPLATKYPYVCHAEMNAILNKNGASIEGAKMYVTMFPCNECAKLMIQAGIKEVIFHEDKMAIKDTNSSKSKSSNSNSNSRSSGVINGNRPESPPNKDGFKQAEQYAASKRLLEMAGIKVRQHRFKRPVVLELSNDVGATSLPLSTSVFVQGGGRREVGAGGEEGSRMTSTSARSTGGKMMVVEEELEGKDLTKSFLNAIYEPPKPETSVNW
jgi:dCMP deaminase